MKNIVLGILAHVDAGKTTLSEGMMYRSGSIDRLGRVDRRDAHLDTNTLERERGITIFSKQAIMDIGDTHITLIDTPGHVDFACETERALSVQDYAILLVSAPDGVRAHTKTLWQMLSARKIPTFIFVNKTDIADRRRDDLLAELKTSLSAHCVDFTKEGSEEFYEEVAGCDVSIMERYFNGVTPETEEIAEAIRRRSIFPCYFGSALKLTGVDELMRGIDRFTLPTEYSETLFGAKIYKIARDETGKRMSFAKITGGSLRPKDVIRIRDTHGRVTEEKVEELRVFSGDKSRPLKEALPGTVCAIYGPAATRAGMGLGTEAQDVPSMAPVLDYRLILPPGANPYETFLRLSALAEEDPNLGIRYDRDVEEIRVGLMGEVQREVLERLIKDRLSLSVSFDEGRILYKETIAATVYGAGHFEPLRHYSEVHLRLDPLPEGSGVVGATECPTDSLATSWQRLVLTHIDEKTHRGTLIGAPLTDVRITLVAGRAHVKHTEGGDFREATYRAIRQGLMKAEGVLLEPTFDFHIELPAESLGRAMTDITSMCGTAEPPVFEGDTAILEGNCPVSTMRSYPSTLRAYTKGASTISLSVGPYMPCHDQEAVVEAYGYDPETDLNNTANSIFCKNGVGHTVLWREADGYMHIKPAAEGGEEETEDTVPVRARARVYGGSLEEDKELMRIFEATYGKVKPRKAAEKKEIAGEESPAPKRRKPKPKGDEVIIVDGYNVIFAWEELARTAESDLALARDILTRIMCDYTAFRRCKGIVVFDAYRRHGGEGSVEKCGNVTVVYTKEAETADAYIEKTTYEIAEENTVRVVTSDMQEQYIILGVGALRVSAAEFRREIENTYGEIRESIDYYKVKRG